jgi:hypothetical protein
LWKTFGNWIEAVQHGLLNPETTSFEIYVSRKVGGSIVNRFDRAKSQDECEQAVEKARLKLSERKLSRAIAKHAAKFLHADEALVRTIVGNFALFTGSGNSQEDLMEIMRTKWVPEELVQDALDHALGWVKARVDRMLEQGRPAVIKVETFRKEMTAFIRRCDRRAVLASFAKDPNADEIKADLMRMYVRQLEIIDCSLRDKIQAITDYFKASVDRTKWAVEGFVHEDSPTTIPDIRDPFSVFCVTDKPDGSSSESRLPGRYRLWHHSGAWAEPPSAGS